MRRRRGGDRTKKAILGAFQLYLDFINLFVMLLPAAGQPALIADAFDLASARAQTPGRFAFGQARRPLVVAAGNPG